MKALLLVFFFSCCMHCVSAQNLVRNPSLETIKVGVEGYRGVSGTPDIASTDNQVVQYPPYYNPYQADMPSRSVATIAFGEICLCQWFSSETSELMQVELLKPLKKNRQYVVSLYTIKASEIEPAIREITVHFTRRPLSGTRAIYGDAPHPLTGEAIPYLALTSAAKPILNSRDAWMEVSAVYTAKGGERHLILGNFIGANKTELEAMNPEGAAASDKHYKMKGTYYCYDNISVVPIEEADEPELISAATETIAIPADSDFAIGKTLTLGDVNFASGEHRILPLAFPMLDALVLYLQDNEEAAVLIQGHTDNVGSDQDNLDLSLRRAEAVKSYLVGGGVPAARISSEGLGESQPKATNDSDANRAQNRRVEIGIRQK
jgi:OmpA-OmpF porin, OOP family